MRNEHQIKAILNQINGIFGFNVTMGLELASSQPIFHMQILRGVERYVSFLPQILNEVALISFTGVVNKVFLHRYMELDCSPENARRLTRKSAPAKTHAGAYMVASFPNDPKRIIGFSRYSKYDMLLEQEAITIHRFGAGMFHFICHEFTHVMIHALEKKHSYNIVEEITPLYKKALESRKKGVNMGIGNYAFEDPEEFLCEIVAAYVMNPDSFNPIIKNIGGMFVKIVNSVIK